MMQIIIHSLGGKQWHGVELVGYGRDSLTGKHDVMIVRCPALSCEYDLEFYVELDEWGHYANVGNHAFWVTIGE